MSTRGEKSFFEIYPHLLQYWSVVKNNPADPHSISQYNERRYWFRCINNKHDILLNANNISGNKGRISCKYCSSILETNPEIIPFIHPTKNSHINFDDITHKSLSHFIWWICPINPLHEWQQQPANWCNKGSCPYCNNIKINETNCISVVYPEILNFWHPTKNIVGINNIARKASKPIWLRCPINHNHEWQKEPKNIVKISCHFCNSIITSHPQFLNFWDYEKNNINPEFVSRGSFRKLWWKCNNNHSWQVTLNSYKKEKMCCSQCERVEYLKNNSLAITHPFLLKEWSEDNSIKLNELTYGSVIKIKWKCLKNKNHTFMASPSSRIGKGSNCPFCSLCVSKGETELLDFLSIPLEKRNNRIIVNERVFFPDYVDHQHKLIIEYNGDRVHGNPKYYKSTDIHDKFKVTFGELYTATLNKKAYLEAHGWIVISIWESEWNKAKKCFVRPILGKLNDNKIP